MTLNAFKLQSFISLTGYLSLAASCHISLCECLFFTSKYKFLEGWDCVLAFIVAFYYSHGDSRNTLYLCAYKRKKKKPARWNHIRVKPLEGYVVRMCSELWSKLEVCIRAFTLFRAAVKCYQTQGSGLDAIILWTLRGKTETVWSWNHFILRVGHCQDERGKWEMSQENIFAWVWFRGWTESQAWLFILLSCINSYLIVEGDSFSS